VNRLLLAVVAVAVIALGGFAVFVIASGGSGPAPVVVTSAPPAGSPSASTTGTRPPASAPAVAPAQPGNEAEAKKRFAAWQESISGAGFTATAAGVGMIGNSLALNRLDLTGSGWHWTAAAARIDVAGATNFDITTNGDQTLSFTFNGNAVEYKANGQVKFGLHQNSQNRIVSVELMKLSVEGEAAPITLDSGGLRLVSDPESEFAPEATAGELRLSKLVVPALAGSPLGARIDMLSTNLFFQKSLPSSDPSKALQPWLGQADPLALPTVNLTWGTLKLTGVGAVGLDAAGRPTGRFEVRVADVLGMLDGFHAVGRFDRNELSKTYAKLLLDDGRVGNSLGLQFTISIANGVVTLSGQSHGIDDLPLGTVGQLYAPTATR
jgi:hypothetical protein